MILQKKTINNVPTLVPLTADAGSGVPVGTIIGQYKKVTIPGYLYLDGSTFDETQYPALYAYLGTNVLPDYREFVLVGAEQNTNSTTIADHDVFTQGEEKDDQIQRHTHQAYNTNTTTGSETPPSPISYTLDIGNRGFDNSLIGYPKGARSGDVTRTKEKAVFWYIKATTGIIESEATEMLNLYNEQNSYSTSEINTGKKWVDGKPIYRKTFVINDNLSNINTGLLSDLNIGVVIKCDTLIWQNSIRYVYTDAIRYNTSTKLISIKSGLTTEYCSHYIIEYTKTTD